jgi:hypothetical protein
MYQRCLSDSCHPIYSSNGVGPIKTLRINPREYLNKALALNHRELALCFG